MTVVTLEALETAFGGPVEVSSGTVTAQYWAGTGPVTKIDGERVIFPREMRAKITDGRPVDPLDLIPTRGVRCVRWEITTAQGTRVKFYTEIPDVVTIGIGDLQQVDPVTFEPTGDVVAAWEAVVAAVQADRERAEAASAEAVASAATAGVSATSAEGDASAAAGSATDAGAARDEAVTAAGTASTAAGDAETARAGAVDAQGVAESAQAAASASETAAVAARTAAESAQTGAEAAETSAAAAQAAAEDAATVATTARTGAESARDTAQETADGIPAAVAVAIAAQAGKIVQGVGMPTGVVTADTGTLYVDTAATNGASVWRKASRTDAAGWVVTDGDTGWRAIARWASNGVVTSGEIPTGLAPIDGVAGGIYLRRVADRVQIAFGDVQTVALNPTITSPLGFRSNTSPPYTARPLPRSVDGVDGLGYLEVGATIYRLRVPADARIQSGGGGGYGVIIDWTTVEAWPTALPGIPT